MAESESGNVGGSVDLHEHFDVALVMLVLILIFVCAGQAIGRYIGNSLAAPGVTSFFGG